MKGYRMWCPTTKKIVMRRHLVFDEKVMLILGPNSEDNSLRIVSKDKHKKRSHLILLIDIQMMFPMASRLIGIFQNFRLNVELSLKLD